MQQAGNSTADKKGMWADSTFEDLVQYNDGFRTQLIGTPEQIAERIAAYRKRGVDLILGGFLHFQEEIEYFGAQRAAVGSRNRGIRSSVRRWNPRWRRFNHGCASVGSKPSSTGEVMSYPKVRPVTPDTRPRSNPRISSPRRPNSSEGRPNPALRVRASFRCI